MSAFVLDTDALSLYRRGHPAVVGRVLACPPDGLSITVITVEGQLTGWYTMLRRARSDARLAAAYLDLATTVHVLGSLQILSFIEAAIALEQGAVVVTRNLADFSRVPGLACEDWSR